MAPPPVRPVHPVPPVPPVPPVHSIQPIQSPAPVLRSRPRALVLLAMLLLLLAVPSPGAARAEGPRWQWPVPAPHEVLARFEAPASPYGPGHRGIDIAVPGGAAVRAVEGGTVRFSGAVAGRGVVSVVHADGLISTYEPVAGTLGIGEVVAAGDVLGTLEGGSPASHCGDRDCLHLGARRGELYVDPLPLLGGRGPSVLLPWSGGTVGTGIASRARAGVGPVGDAGAETDVRSGADVGSGAGVDSDAVVPPGRRTASMA